MTPKKMTQQKQRNKKREHNAPLFKTCVSVNTDSNLIINREWVDPNRLITALKKTSYEHILASIVKHCMSESLVFDDKLNKLLKHI